LRRSRPRSSLEHDEGLALDRRDRRGVYFGAQWIQQNPHAVDIQKTQPGVYQPQPQNQSGGKMVVNP